MSSSNNSTGVVCPDGWGPDLLMRFPMEPFFPEPYGQNCDFHYTGYNVFASIVLIDTVIVLLLHVWWLQGEANQLSLWIKLLQMVALVLEIAILITSWTAPTKVYIVYCLFLAVFMILGFAWLILGHRTVLRTIVKVALNKDVTVVSLMGGRVALFAFCATILCSFIVEMAGLIGTIVLISVGDLSTGVISFRVACGAMAIGTQAFVIVALVTFTRFIRVIQNVMKSTQELGNSGYKSDLLDVVKRFRVARFFFALAAPGGVGLYVLQAAVLPAWWFIILINLISATNVCFAVLFLLTPEDRRGKKSSKLTSSGDNDDKNPHQNVAVVGGSLPSSSRDNYDTTRQSSRAAGQPIMHVDNLVAVGNRMGESYAVSTANSTFQEA